MSDSEGSELTTSTSGSRLGKPARSVTLAACLPVLLYFRNHEPFPDLRLPSWVVAGLFGALFAALGIMDLRTGIAWESHSQASRLEKPALYWMCTCFDLLLGAVGLVAAIGAAVGLWTVR